MRKQLRPFVPIETCKGIATDTQNRKREGQTVPEPFDAQCGVMISVLAGRPRYLTE
jgi:hypothetical protein